MKSKLLHLIWTVLILFSGTVAFGQWTVYDGSVLPEDATPAWTKAQSTAGVSSVVDDPVLTGNKLLLIQDLSETSKELYQLDWNIADPNTGLTIVFRTKPTQEIIDYAPTSSKDDKFLYISPRTGGYQEALAFYYPDQISLNNSSQSATYAETGWTVYRLTMKGDSVNLYLNEQSVPLFAGKTTKSTTDNFLYLGDNTQEPYGGYFDWVVWDLSGAFNPEEGTALPGTLTGLDALDSYFMVTFNVTDGTDPLADATVTFNGSSKTTGPDGKVTFLNNTAAAGLAYTVSLVGYDDATGTLDVVDADVTQNVTLNATASTYSVTFNVSDGTNPLQGASVNFNGTSLTTDASGVAVFTDVSPGTGLAYSVSLTGYVDASGTVDVVDADVSKDVTMNEVSASNWTVYDGSDLLENVGLGWVKDRTTTGVTDVANSVLSSIVDDPDINGNKLLKTLDLSEDTRESWQLEWQVADPNTGLTLMFRAKPAEELLNYAPTVTSDSKIFYISPRNGSYVEAVVWYYPDSLIFNNTGDKIQYNNYGWSLFRITMQGSSMKLYINEDPTPVMSNDNLNTSANNRLLFLDNTTEPYGSYIDWLAWDLTGAFGPGEGSPIPDGLSLAYDVPSSVNPAMQEEKVLSIYPNPVSSVTKIQYVVEQPGMTSLEIFDITGKQVSSLVSRFMQPGKYTLELNTGDLPAGMYFCRFRSGEHVIVSKLLRN